MNTYYNRIEIIKDIMLDKTQSSTPPIYMKKFRNLCSLTVSNNIVLRTYTLEYTIHSNKLKLHHT